MLARKVRVSDKGQVAIPVDVRRDAGIRTGDDLILIQAGDKILLEKSEKIAKRIKDDFSDLLKHSEKTAKTLWGSKADDIWDSV